MSATDDKKLESAAVAAFVVAHGDELRRFLVGVLRDPQLAADAMQMAFTKLVERGHEASDESRKSWLFQVAYREALALRRREATGQRVLRKVSWGVEVEAPATHDLLVRGEQVEAVQRALERLPKEQQQVVRLRMYEERTFAEIAEALQIPLGTALSRMQAALRKLRSEFRKESADDETQR